MVSSRRCSETCGPRWKRASSTGSKAGSAFASPKVLPCGGLEEVGTRPQRNWEECSKGGFTWKAEKKVPSNEECMMRTREGSRKRARKKPKECATLVGFYALGSMSGRGNTRTPKIGRIHSEVGRRSVRGGGSAPHNNARLAGTENAVR